MCNSSAAILETTSHPGSYPRSPPPKARGEGRGGGWKGGGLCDVLDVILVIEVRRSWGRPGFFLGIYGIQ